MATRGFSLVTLTANAARNARLHADSFIRNQGTVTFFRGSNLGTSPVASQAAGTTNITFTQAPILKGGGGEAGTTTVSILAGAYGSTSTSDIYGEGLVTYDATYGLRLLDFATEYAGDIVAGQTQLDNVRLVGSTGGFVSKILNANTTVNSLSLIAPAVTSGGAGVILTGSGTLTLASGVIFASQAVTGGVVPSDSLLIGTNALDFNGNEGFIIVARTNAQGGASDITNAPLEISSVITNTGGNGLTKGGQGYLKLTGAVANTYTGPTTVTAGTLGLGKSVNVNAIGGDLWVTGGAVYWINSHQIADDADIYVYGGSVNFRPSNNTGSSRAETFGDLFMSGGAFVAGSSGTENNLISMSTATLEGGSMTLNRNNDVAVAGEMAISNGATVSVARANASTGVYDTNLTVGGLTITNTESDAYTPITIHPGTGATNFGGRLVLNGNLTFNGNASNANTVLIAAPEGDGPRGVLALQGTRTFTINDGAAAVDLLIEANIIDASAGSGLIKTGEGTLALEGDGLYIGLTTVNAGTLLVNGSLAGDVTVNGGVLGGTGAIAGEVSIGSGGTLAPGNSAGSLDVGNLSLLGSTSTIAMEITGANPGNTTRSMSPVWST